MDIRSKLVDAGNAELCKLLDPMLKAGGRSVNVPLVTVYYPYGSLIVEGGTWCQPQPSGDMEKKAIRRIWPVGQNDKQSKAPAADRPSIPLGVVLSNSAEVFTSCGTEDALETEIAETVARHKDTKRLPRKMYYGSYRVISQRFLRRGDFFGAFEVGDFLAAHHVKGFDRSYSKFSISSGARCVHLIWPLGDMAIQKGLPSFLNLPYKYALRTIPELFSWHIFRVMASRLEIDWSTEVFYVPQEWYCGDNSHSRVLREYLSSYAWAQSSGQRRHESDAVGIWDTLHSLKGLSLEAELFTPRCIALLASLREIATGRRHAFFPVAPASVAESPNPDAGPFTTILTRLVEACAGRASDTSGNTLCFFEPSFRSYEKPIILYPGFPAAVPTSKVIPNGLLSYSMPCFGPAAEPTPGEWHKISGALNTLFENADWREKLELDGFASFQPYAFRSIRDTKMRTLGLRSVSALKLTQFDQSLKSLERSRTRETQGTLDERVEDTTEKADFYDGHPFFQCVIVMEQNPERLEPPGESAKEENER